MQLDDQIRAKENLSLTGKTSFKTSAMVTTRYTTATLVGLLLVSAGWFFSLYANRPLLNPTLVVSGNLCRMLHLTASKVGSEMLANATSHSSSFIFQFQSFG